MIRSSEQQVANCWKLAAKSIRSLVIGYSLFTVSGLLTLSFALAFESEVTSMKRRQQGILTGMPFMANLAPRTFVDDLGRRIYLAKPPSRIVSLAPSVTEILFAIGSGEDIVGVTHYCDYPPEALSKPKVGYTYPSLETILALNPDLVLAPHEFLRADLLDKLDQLKIPTYILEAKTVEDVLSHIQTLGRMLGRVKASQALAGDMRRRIEEVKALTQRLPRPRLLYVLNTDPLITVGPGSFIHQLIGLAGGANVAEGADSAYPQLSLEAVLKEDPQILLFPIGAVEGIPESEQRQWERWTTISAVQQRRFHHISSNLLNRPGPRLVQGLEELARILHPDVFTKKLGP